MFTWFEVTCIHTCLEVDHKVHNGSWVSHTTLSYWHLNALTRHLKINLLSMRLYLYMVWCYTHLGLSHLRYTMNLWPSHTTHFLELLTYPKTYYCAKHLRFYTLIQGHFSREQDYCVPGIYNNWVALVFYWSAIKKKHV